MWDGVSGHGPRPSAHRCSTPTNQREVAQSCCINLMTRR